MITWITSMSKEMSDIVNFRRVVFRLIRSESTSNLRRNSNIFFCLMLSFEDLKEKCVVLDQGECVEALVECHPSCVVLRDKNLLSAIPLLILLW